MDNKSDNTAANQTPQEDLGPIEGHPTLPPLNVDMDKVKEDDPAIGYDESFFSLEPRENADDSWDSAAEPAPESITSEIAESASASIENEVVTEAPTELDEGSQMTSFLLRGKPLSVSHSSNQTFSSINSDEAAHVALTGLRFDNNNLDMRMTEFGFDDKHKKIHLAELSDVVQPDATLDEEGWLDDDTSDLLTQQETSLRLHCDLERKMLTCNTTSKVGPRCFFIDGNNVSDVTGAESMDINKPGFIVVLSTGIMRALVGGVTKGAYKGPVVYKGETPTFIDEEKEEQIEIPLEFLVADAANYLKALVDESFAGTETVVDGRPSYTNTPVKRLFNKLSEIQNKTTGASNDKWDTIHTESFAIYELA